MSGSQEGALSNWQLTLLAAGGIAILVALVGITTGLTFSLTELRRLRRKVNHLSETVGYLVNAEQRRLLARLHSPSSLIDLENDTADNVAEVIINGVARNKAGQIASGIENRLKTK